MMFMNIKYNINKLLVDLFYLNLKLKYYCC